MNELKVLQGGEGVRERLARYLEGGGRSQAEVAAATGLSAATISQWRRGTYAGDNATVEAKIASFLEMEERRSRNPSRGFVATRLAREVMLVCELAHENLTIGVISGEAGMGKTTALKEYCRRHPEAIYIRCNPSYRTPKALLEGLLHAIGRDPRGWNSLNRLVDEAVESLAGRRLVILDEAQFMSRESLEIARTMHDECGIPMVLAGNYDLYNRMMGKAAATWAQVFSRVGIHREIRRNASIEDVRLLVGEGVSEACIEYLHARSREPGGLRRVDMVLRLGRKIAEKARKDLDVECLEMACSLLMGGEEA